MLHHWIEPVDQTTISGAFQRGDGLAHQIRFHESFEKLQSGGRSIAIIASQQRWTNRVRTQLYQFADAFPSLRIHDLGNFRKSDPDFVAPALAELISSGILPVVLSRRPSYVLAFARAFQILGMPMKIAMLHEGMPASLSSMDAEGDILGSQLHVTGLQCPESVRKIMLHRLGTLRSALHSTEPIIRDSSLIVADARSIKLSEFPAQRPMSSSGFTVEEVCQMMRYAGLGTHRKGVLFTGYDAVAVSDAWSTNAMAQMMWYFLHGCEQNLSENPLKDSHILSYAIHIQELDVDLTFYKSPLSDRWWVSQAGSMTCASCGYEDYNTAAAGEISDSVMRYLTSSVKHTNKAL